MPVGSNEGCSDLAEPSLKHGGRTMTEYSEVFVAFDTSKTKHAVAVAESGRDGEIRYLGEIESGPEAVWRLGGKLAGGVGKGDFWFEAGPAGAGLFRALLERGDG